MKAISILVGVLLIVAGGAAYYTKYLSADPPVNFRTVPVKQGDLVALVSATGTLEPEEVVDVGSQVTGPIASLGKDPKDPSKSIDYDSEVEEGTLLAKVDDSVYKAQYDQAEANLLHAQADMGELQAHLDQCKAEWKRAKALRAPEGHCRHRLRPGRGQLQGRQGEPGGGQGDRQAERGGPGDGQAEPRLLHHHVRPSRA